MEDPPNDAPLGREVPWDQHEDSISIQRYTSPPNEDVDAIVAAFHQFPQLRNLSIYLPYDNVGI